jgi:hypothetical protein
MRTFELVHVRCTACMTSRAAKPMAGERNADTEVARAPQGQVSGTPQEFLPTEPQVLEVQQDPRCLSA